MNLIEKIPISNLIVDVTNPEQIEVVDYHLNNRHVLLTKYPNCDISEMFNSRLNFSFVQWSSK